MLVLWNLVVICQYRYGWIPAAAGAPLEELLGNVPRLIARKRFLLVGQVLLGPALLWLLGRRLVSPVACCKMKEAVKPSAIAS